MMKESLMRWTQALTLLFEAARPLTFDCMRTKEESKALDKAVFDHIIYCEHVKGAIEDGVEPLSWDDWSSKASKFEVNAVARPVKITQEDLQQLTNDLNRAFESPILRKDIEDELL